MSHFYVRTKNIRIKINPLQILLMGAVARLSAFVVCWYAWSNQSDSSTSPHGPIRIKNETLLTNQMPERLPVICWTLNNMNTRPLQALLNAIKQRIALQRFIFQSNYIQCAQTIKIVNLCDFLIPASLWIVWSMAIWKSCSGENMKICPGQHPVTFKIWNMKKSYFSALHHDSWMTKLLL